MALNSKIEWTETTWNPITGCSKISQGCTNCYAERMAKRLNAMGVKRYEDGFKVRVHEDLIDSPKNWTNSRLIFVNSMSDLFHEDVSDNTVLQIFETMNKCTNHIFQVLTKRSQRLLELSKEIVWTDNIWMGVSVENQQVAFRILDLLNSGAKTKFLSCEPLLGPVLNLPSQGLDWVIVGGESGPKSRKMEPDWVEQLFTQCKTYRIPFFFKQWGGTQKKKNGRSLHGKQYSEMPINYYLSRLYLALIHR